MRKALPIVGAVIGVLVLLFIALVGYAIVNLNSIVNAHRTEILSRADAALSRRVDVHDISASLGWGVMVDLKGVNVADDPAFSTQPFLTAHDIYVKVAFIPLLFRRLQVERLLLDEPAVRIIRNHSGSLNVSTLGKKRAYPAAPANPPAKPAALKSSGRTPVGNNPMETAPGQSSPGALNAISIRTLTIDDGSLYYDDQQSGTPFIINKLELKLSNFSTTSPFDVKLAMAAFGNEANIILNGQAGPIGRAGQLDIPATPLNLNMTVGPLSLAQMRTVAPLARLIPAQLSISQPLNVKATLGGTVQAASFNVSSDLTQNHVIYQGQMDKPAGVPFIVSADGRREHNRIQLNHAELTLASLQMKASNVTLEAGNLKARLDTNDFALAPLGRILTPAARYNPGGDATLHADITIANKQPEIIGELRLAQVALALPGGNTPPISGLGGVIKINRNNATAGPLTFNLGSGHATLQAAASSLQPLAASYDFKADVIKLAELVPSRKNVGDERLNQFAARGALSGSARDLRNLHATANVSSSSGMVANVPYQNLALLAAYGADRVEIKSLKLGAYGGTIAASGAAALNGDRRFDLMLACNNLNVQQAMEAQKAKAAETVRGLLTGNVHVSGAGSNFAQIRPSLRGDGRVQVRNGKLMGVNVVAQALSKVDNLPGIGALIPASITSRHPELFRNPDTDIQKASLSFTLSGPRITSHDINVLAADYTILGDGWFDMDKNIDLAARILLSRAFSDEIVAARKNAALLANQDGQVEVPLRISGRLPKPLVAPDVQVLARRATSHALQKRLGGLLEKKGLGGLFGGSAGSSNPLRRFLP